MSKAEFLEKEKSRLTCAGSCDPARVVLCRAINSTGHQIACWHCTQCGSWKAVKKEAVDNISSLPERDDSVITRNKTERALAFEAERTARATAWWARYSAYLKTDKWRRKSETVVARDGMCQACLVRPATQAHHLTYHHVGDEPLFDLKGVCAPCHEKITRMDRLRRESGLTPLDEVDP